MKHYGLIIAIVGILILLAWGTHIVNVQTTSLERLMQTHDNRACIAGGDCEPAYALAMSPVVGAVGFFIACAGLCIQENEIKKYKLAGAQ